MCYQGHERAEAMKRVDKLNEHIRSSEQALEEQRRLRAELQVTPGFIIVFIDVV